MCLQVCAGAMIIIIMTKSSNDKSNNYGTKDVQKQSLI